MGMYHTNNFGKKYYGISCRLVHANYLAWRILSYKYRFHRFQPSQIDRKTPEFRGQLPSNLPSEVINLLMMQDFPRYLPISPDVS